MDKKPSRPVILVVDDSPENLDVLKTTLRAEYTIRPATHGALALKLAEISPKPDLILLDVMMPDMDGYETCQQLKANPATRSIPVIFVTAKTEVEDELRGLAVGGVDYIQKPISPPVVRARVKTHLALQRALLRVEENNRKLHETNEKLSASLTQLSASEERFRNLVQTIPDIVYKIDTDGRFTFVNKSIERLGYYQAELLGRHFTEIIHPTDSDRACRKKLLEDTAASQPGSQLKMFDEKRTQDRITSGLELRIKRKSGEETELVEIENIDHPEIFVEVSSSGLYGETFGTPPTKKERTYIGTVGVMRDITLRKKFQEKLRIAKEQAEEATRIKDKFVSLVAHDLRSPLGAILGAVEYVLDDEEFPIHATHRQLLENASHSSRNLVKLIEEVLNIGRLQTGKITLEKQFFNARILVQEMVWRLDQLRAKKNLVIDNALPENMRLFADRALIGEVVQNLLSNAIKFSQPYAVIRVFAPDVEKTILAVQDQGVGIANGMLPKLFSIEEKTSTPGTHGEQGTGFGLPFSYDLMQAHAGQLTVVSKLGKGSTFTLELPPQQPRVLIVANEAATLASLEHMLLPLRVSIVIASNGQEALQHIQKWSIHLILSDLHLPVMDGLTLLEELQKNKKTIPFILIAANQEMAIRDRAFRMGAADFAVKPIQSHDLLPRVRYFLGG